MKRQIVGYAVFLMLSLCGAVAQAQIANTLHNLSASGTGTFKDPGVGELCIFCHTPHRAVQTRALWNRDLQPTVYNLYASSTLEATLNQPTGSSRLCLSCHDGTTALGNLRVQPRNQPSTLGPLQGRASLGTDLSDDHPISFVYDAQLALKQGQLADPSTLPKALHLDATGQLQCTTCHDPHDDKFRKFLRMDDRAGALCTTCHKQRNWAGSAHASSTATWNGQGQNPWSGTPYNSVSDNACLNCHRNHAAPRPPRLLSEAQESQVCLVCHNGTVAGKNLESEFSKTSVHPVTSSNYVHEPREDPNTMPRHVSCVDCHNPHQASSSTAVAPSVSGATRGVRGVSISGSTVSEATSEYEICLKCHGLQDQNVPGRVVRQDNTRNIRLKINPSNPSFHPVAAVGKNTTMTDFEPGYSTASVIYCTDCHNNDEWTSGGARPRGPHGSNYAPILEREYRTNDPSPYSFQAYAMCFKCHNSTSFTSDSSSKPFNHWEHLHGSDIGCAACHDAHGSRQYVGLINFMLRDPAGKVVVQPSQNQKRLEFIKLGPNNVQCYLLCHGKNHEPLTYPN